MATPYDEFAQAYPGALAAAPSPYVTWLETNRDGYAFVAVSGMAQAYQKAVDRGQMEAGVLVGRLWSWKQFAASMSNPWVNLAMSPQQWTIDTSVTITGRGGSVTLAPSVAWNNENSWNGLQIYKRADLGGIDLDWMAVGCNAVLLPFPQDDIGTCSWDFYLAVGFKIMTANGASQFFYPGGNGVELVTSGGSTEGTRNGITGWGNCSPIGLPCTPSWETGSTPQYPAPPVVVVGQQNTSPTAQLPVVVATCNAQQLAGDTVTCSNGYAAFGIASGEYDCVQSGDSLSFQTSDQYYPCSFPQPPTLVSGGSGTFSIEQQGGDIVAVETLDMTVNLAGETSGTSTTVLISPSSCGEKVQLVAGSVSWNVPTDCVIDGVPCVGSSGVSATFDFSITPPSGNDEEFFLIAPGGCAVIYGGSIQPAYSSATCGSIYNPQNSYTLSYGSWTLNNSTFAYPIMQVPVGSDTFLVTY